MTCKCTCKSCCCNEPKDEYLVCEAGFLWRRVLRRLEKRVNGMLAAGWRLCPLDNRYQMKEGNPLCLWGIYTEGFLRRMYIAKLVMAKPDRCQTVIDGEQCALQNGHDGRHMWQVGD